MDARITNVYVFVMYMIKKCKFFKIENLKLFNFIN